MSAVRSLLIVATLTIVCFGSTESRIPTNIQNLELDDITSLWEKLPNFFNKIKDAINRFRCPKGWRRLGGSCYLLPGVPSLSSEANETCNLVHSNRSNLMKIRNTYELFYAAHVLTKYNLSGLIVEVDPHSLKGRFLTDLLLDDHHRWLRIKESILDMRRKYLSIKEKFFKELESAGIRISRRSKKFDKFIDRHRYTDFIEDYQNGDETNRTSEFDDYEYEDLHKDDDNEDDDYDRFQSISNMCDRIDWNVIQNQSSVYLLTTYMLSNKVVCSLSDVDPRTEYDHLCQYVLDFCFANFVCGTNGRCVNTLSGFKCSCGFLYGGLLCEHVSKQGYQIIISMVLVIFFYSLSFKPIRFLLTLFVDAIIFFVKGCFSKKREESKNRIREDLEMLLDATKLRKRENSDPEEEEETFDGNQDKKTDDEVNTFQHFLLHCCRNIDVSRFPHSVENPNKTNLARTSWVGILTIFFLSVLFIVTTVVHFTSFKYEINDDVRLESVINETSRLISRCGTIANYRIGNMIFAPIAVALIFMFSWSIKREKKGLDICEGRPGIIPPIEPFRTGNRFSAAAVFGILSFEILKIFEEMLFSQATSLSHGIIYEIVERLATIILVGLRYYPVLGSLQLRNIGARFFACLYILADIVFATVRESLCMGYLPLSGFYSVLEEAKLRMELGTWFIIYGLLKNTPHFIFLSYIGAELWVRFAYDSVYTPLKNKRSIWESPVNQSDESAFAKYYVSRLFRKSVRQIVKNRHFNKESISGTEYYLDGKNKKPKKSRKTRLQKFIDWIYPWDVDFRFTNMATCTFAVAFVFLYYLACTFVFLYIFRTSGHIAFVRDYIESALGVELKGFFSLKVQIIVSALITVGIYSWQLFLGICNYKKHKQQLFKGIYEEVPSVANFNVHSIPSKSVHYSGYLVGYMAWGFVISFHIILLFLTLLRVLTIQTYYLEIVLAFAVPVMLIYLLNILGNSTAGRFFFVRTLDEKLNLENRKTYAIFVYFNFFADCFLGMASCVNRLIKAMFLNIFFMARLDCSFLGRPIERLDIGFAAYVSYLHMEVTHTNPILLAFCYSVYDDVVKRRPKANYDDECCIAAIECEEESLQTQRMRERIILMQSLSRTLDQNEKQPVNERTAIIPIIGVSGRQAPGSIIEKIPEHEELDEDNNQNETEDEEDEDDDDNEDEDGGLPVPTVSTIARLVPQTQPVLPPESALPPILPRRSDIPNNDIDEDDDGGPKVSTTETIARLMPMKRPQLPPNDSSAAPPPIPPRSDFPSPEDDDEDDDGGLKPKPIVKNPKKEPKVKVPKPKFEDDDDDGVPFKKPIIKTPKPDKKKTSKPSKPLLLDDDEDGGVQREPKVKPPPKPKPKPIPLQRDEGEDDDGAIKRSIKPSKPEKVKPTKAVRKQSDDDDDGVPIQVPKSHPPKIKKQKSVMPQKRIKDEGEDEDGGLEVTTYDTVRKMMPKKTSAPDRSSRLKESSPEMYDDGSMIKLKTVAKQQSSHDTVIKLHENISNILLKSAAPTNIDNHYDTLPSDAERAARSDVTYEPPSYPQAANLPLLRTVSYREAQQSTPPLIQRRTTMSSIRSQNSTNEDASHYSEIGSHETKTGGIINRSYSNNGSIQSSNHSLKQQRIETVPEHSENRDLNGNDRSDYPTENATQEPLQQQQPQQQNQRPKIPRRGPLLPIPNISTAFPTISGLIDPSVNDQIETVKKRKRARFRWFLAYTIINNYHLFDLRKQVQSRLAQMRIHRGIIADEMQQAAISPEPMAIPMPMSMPMPMPMMARSMAVPMIEMASAPAPAPPVQSFSRGNLGVPTIMIDNVPQSRAEQYIAIRSCMFYDSGSVKSRSNNALGPPSEISAKTVPGQPPQYVRQASISPSNRSLQFNPNSTPVFHAIPDSNQSVAEYPMTNLSIGTSSTLRAQMSYGQHMEAYRQRQLSTIQKKKQTSYFYGPPAQRNLHERISTASILLPQMLPINSDQRNQTPGTRLPSASPFASAQLKKDPKRKVAQKKNLRTTTVNLPADDSENMNSQVADL